jgi:hypothetical protein
LPSLIKGRPSPNNNNNNNNNKAKCIPGGTLRVLAGKNSWTFSVTIKSGLSIQKMMGSGWGPF